MSGTKGKFHIGKNGPAPCKAEKRACKLGGNGHYDTLQEATEVYHKIQEKAAQQTEIPKNQKIEDSSVLTEMSYENGVLELTYKNGEAIAYNATEEQVQEFLNAESKGRYLQELKDNKIALTKTGISEEDRYLDKDFIDSSFLEGATYKNGFMMVDMKGDKRYLYTSNEGEARYFMTAENKGSYFAKNI